MTRRARPSESGALTDLARASKASWGYPEEWLAEWAGELTITPEYVELATVFVTPSEGPVEGMIAVRDGEQGPEIEHLWIAPDAQGRGFGRSLLERARSHAAGRGWLSLRIVSDPNAVPFYERLGAVQSGEIAAPVAGVDRRLPVLSLPVAEPHGPSSGAR